MAVNPNRFLHSKHRFPLPLPDPLRVLVLLALPLLAGVVEEEFETADDPGVEGLGVVVVVLGKMLAASPVFPIAVSAADCASLLDSCCGVDKVGIGGDTALLDEGDC